VKGVHRSRCPINLTLEMLGDGWSLIVIRDIMFGNRRWCEQPRAGVLSPKAMGQIEKYLLAVQMSGER
jgi:DNA-binding HxlR family transcriptional regulator